MVFLAASNTLNQSYIRFFTPLYFLFLSLSWRAFQPALFSSQTFWKRGFVLAGVLGMSALVHGGVWHYRQEISNWGMQFLEGRSMESTGLSTDPHLGSRFNLRGSANRMLRLENVRGNEEGFYLRVAAFSDYENNRWLPQINREAGPILASRASASAAKQRAAARATATHQAPDRRSTTGFRAFANRRFYLSARQPDSMERAAGAAASFVIRRHAGPDL